MHDVCMQSAWRVLLITVLHFDRSLQWKSDHKFWSTAMLRPWILELHFLHFEFLPRLLDVWSTYAEPLTR
jgi:hypothetical protein